MIFENATILTMNDERQIVEQGAVAVSGSRIAAVGKSREVVERFPDERTGDTTYSMADAALGAFSVFFTQSPSFLDFQRNLQVAKGCNNALTLFGITQIPSDNQIRNLLDPVPPSAVFPLFGAMVEALHQGGHLEAYRGPGGLAYGAAGLEYKPTETGFYALVRLRGDQALVEISPQKQSLNRNERYAVDTQRISTTVSGERRSRQVRSPSYPPWARELSKLRGSTWPQFSRTMRGAPTRNSPPPPASSLRRPSTTGATRAPSSSRSRTSAFPRYWQPSRWRSSVLRPARSVRWSA